MPEFFIKGVPKPKGSVHAYARGVAVHTKTSKEWEQIINFNLLQNVRTGPIFNEGPVFVELDFYLPKPKSARRKSPYVYPDLDKLVRAILDAMTGIIFKDDSQVTEIRTRKLYADNETSAGVKITVEALEL